LSDISITLFGDISTHEFLRGLYKFIQNRMKHMKNLLVLPAVKNIEKSAKEMDSVNVTTGRFKDVEILIKDNRPQIFFQSTPLESFDSIWLSSFWSSRAIAYTIKLYLESKNIHHSHVEKNSSKLTDQMAFALAGLPVPDTYFYGGPTNPALVEKIEKHLTYPLIIKDNKGSMGRHSFLVHSREELTKCLFKLPTHKKFQFQEFIPNDYDWGVMVVHGQVISGEKSFGQGKDFRNNACNGAKEVFVPVKDIPQDIKDLAIQASATLGLKWSRADIIIDKRDNSPHLLEVNRTPGITKGTTEEKGAQAFLKNFLDS
jgi:glutathione synthase/RimK-type ligase-like ATP-grasp enzyme